MSNPSIPSARAPVVDGEGRVQQVWLRFFSDLWIRTGGFTDNVNASNDELDEYSSAESFAQAQRLDDAEILTAMGREAGADVHALRQQIADNEILHSMGF